MLKSKPYIFRATQAARKDKLNQETIERGLKFRKKFVGLNPELAGYDFTINKDGSVFFEENIHFPNVDFALAMAEKKGIPEEQVKKALNKKDEVLTEYLTLHKTLFVIKLDGSFEFTDYDKISADSFR